MRQGHTVSEVNPQVLLKPGRTVSESYQKFCYYVLASAPANVHHAQAAAFTAASGHFAGVLGACQSSGRLGLGFAPDPLQASAAAGCASQCRPSASEVEPQLPLRPWHKIEFYPMHSGLSWATVSEVNAKLHLCGTPSPKSTQGSPRAARRHNTVPPVVLGCRPFLKRSLFQTLPRQLYRPSLQLLNGP